MGNTRLVKIGAEVITRIELDRVAGSATPRRLLFEDLMRERLAAVAPLRDGDDIDVAFAYSVKTNPDPRLLAVAREAGWWAETISSGELAAAREAGFDADRLIYNGPQPPPNDARWRYRFADSIEALREMVQQHRPVGVRLRPAMTHSRFGVPVDDDALLIDVLRAGNCREVAISLHVARAELPGASWRDAVDDVLRRAERFRAEAGTRIVAIDGGGGWEAATFEQTFPGDVRWLVERARTLGGVERVLFEPGQGVTGGSEALLGRIVEVRVRPGRTDVVVDLGYADWPDQHAFVHELFVARDGRWCAVGRGGDRLLGATCLEYDLIEGLRFPAGTSTGDLVLVTGAGSYDAAMSFPFAHGRRATQAERVA